MKGAEYLSSYGSLNALTAWAGRWYLYAIRAFAGWLSLPRTGSAKGASRRHRVLAPSCLTGGQVAQAKESAEAPPTAAPSFFEHTNRASGSDDLAAYQQLLCEQNKPGGVEKCWTPL